MPRLQQEAPHPAAQSHTCEALHKEPVPTRAPKTMDTTIEAYCDY